MSRLVLIEAPSNLGLRPPAPRQEPGTWRAPAALREAGLEQMLRPARRIELSRPPYRFGTPPGTHILNGPEIRAFSRKLAVPVREAVEEGSMPIVVGGDCSILLGCLLAVRARAPLVLVHVDGHSDFFHPGNHDVASRPGAAAGMDLALATGRGEPLLAEWDGAPLIEDSHVVQIGEREDTDADYPYPDVRTTAIRQLSIRQALEIGIDRTADFALACDGAAAPGIWLHVDLDVLDQESLPAVDSPGSPGLTFAQLSALLGRLLASGRVIGMNLTVFDPELDPDGTFAGRIVACIGEAFGMAGHLASA